MIGIITAFDLLAGPWVDCADGVTLTSIAQGDVNPGIAEAMAAGSPNRMNNPLGDFRQ